jgi:Ger(x)C family germination protein
MRRKIKWIFTIVAILAYFIFGSKIPDEDLSSRAIAVGLGIDLADNGQIIISAQILTAGSTESEPDTTKIIKAQADVPISAVAKISEICGKTLTVTHCNSIIFGEKLIQDERMFEIVLWLFENTYVSDNAYLFACEGQASDILSLSVAFGQNSGLYIQKLISLYGIYDNITYKTLRQFFCDCKNIGGANWLPFIKKVPISAEVPSPTGNETSSAADDEYVFSMSDVSVFCCKKYVGTFGEDASRSINYFLTKVEKGSGEFHLDNDVVGLFITDSSIKKKYDLEKKTVTASLEIGATVKDMMFGNCDDNDTFIYELTDEQKAACEKIIEEKMLAFFNEMRDEDADVFRLRQDFYGKFGKKAENLNLDDITLKINVKIAIRK